KIENGKSKGGRKGQTQERWPARCRRYAARDGGRGGEAYPDVPGDRSDAGARREQGEFHAGEWAAGGCAAVGEGEFRGGAAVFYGVEGTQRGVARACERDGVHVE